jgi:hypothetical protein
MLTAEFLTILKRRNVSSDTDKTKERVSELWDNLNRKVKKEILTFADAKATSIYHTKRLGLLSRKSS